MTSTSTQRAGRHIAKIETAIFGGVMAVSVFACGSAYAWSVEKDYGTSQLIRCADSSQASISQLQDGYWTVGAAGTNGTLGGHYGTSGKAAQAGCGE